MSPSHKDPTDPIRLAASRYPGVDEGAACTQSSFKAGGKAYLYIGSQGGRFKAMFKLKDSLAEAEELAGSDPDDYQVGAGGWVTARFSAGKPMPKKRWAKWLDESYALACPAAPKKAPRKKPAPKKRR